MTPILVFDIETIPDIAGLRRTHDLPAGLSDDAVVAWYGHRRRARSGGDFPPHHLQRIVAIACARRDDSGLKIASVGAVDDPESERRPVEAEAGLDDEGVPDGEGQGEDPAREGEHEQVGDEPV